MTTGLLIAIEIILISLLAIHIQRYRQHQREIDEVHIILMHINDEIVQMTRKLK